MEVGGRHLSHGDDSKLVEGSEPLQRVVLYFRGRLRRPRVIPSDEREVLAGVESYAAGIREGGQTLRLLDGLLGSILAT